MASPDAPTRRNCTVQFGAFVEELDALLASAPRNILIVHALLKKHFPMEACDIETVIQAARRSRFFASVYEAPTNFVVSFDSAGVPGTAGIAAGVGFLKASGNSSLPHANFHLRW